MSVQISTQILDANQLLHGRLSFMGIKDRVYKIILEVRIFFPTRCLPYRFSNLGSRKNGVHSC